MDSNPPTPASDVARPDERPRYSVGRVARLTGIPVETLRIWERRYGAPRPARLPSGHRRYTPAQVSRLRKVAVALAAGERPGRLLGLDEPALEARLARFGAGAPDGDDPLETWVGLLQDLRLRPLVAALGAAWREREMVDFLQAVVTPLLHRVGEAWAGGRLGVRHEHLLSHVVQDMLGAYRLGLDAGRAPPRDPPLVLATLPGEEHGLGLEMVAAVCAERGRPVCLLGNSVPLEQIVAATAECGAHGVGVSLSPAHAGAAADRLLAELRGRLPEAVALIAGGAGLGAGRRGPRGVAVLPDLAAFVRWLDDRR